MIFHTFKSIFDKAPEIVKQKLLSLKEVRENPEYHPEQDAFIHTQIVTDRLCMLGDMDLIMTAFFHDICKKDTLTINKKGNPTCIHHEKEAVIFIESNKEVQDFITSMGANVENVTYLCSQHMRIKVYDEMREAKKAAMRESELFDKLQLFAKADSMREFW